MPSDWRGLSSDLFELFEAWRADHDPTSQTREPLMVSARLVSIEAIQAGWTWKRTADGRIYSPPQYAPAV